MDDSHLIDTEDVNALLALLRYQTNARFEELVQLIEQGIRRQREERASGVRILVNPDGTYAGRASPSPEDHQIIDNEGDNPGDSPAGEDDDEEESDSEPRRRSGAKTLPGTAASNAQILHASASHFSDQSREGSTVVSNSRRRRHSSAEDADQDNDSPQKRRRTNTASSEGSDEEASSLSRTELLRRVLSPNQRVQTQAVRENRQPLSPRGRQTHAVEVGNSHGSFRSTRAANENFNFPVIDMTGEVIRPAVNNPGMRVFGEPALQNFNIGGRLAYGHQTPVPPTRRPNANQFHRRRTPSPARSASPVPSESLPAYEDLSPPPPAYRPTPTQMPTPARTPAPRLRLDSPRPVPRLNLRLGPPPQRLQQNPPRSVEQSARTSTRTAMDRQAAVNQTPIRRSTRTARQKRRQIS